jgi:hypothetical protein
MFEDAHTSAGIMDLHLPGVVIVEMKAPSQVGRLAAHRAQAFNYWHNSADVATDRPAPQYVVLCTFHEFEVWEPGRFPNAPRATFTLKQLPDRYETLLFLAGPEEEPLFGAASRELTTEAAFAMAKVYHNLLDRQAASPEAIQRFLLQMVWLLSAEDYGMVSGKPVEHILKLLATQTHWTSYMMFGGLFMSLNDSSDHGRHGVLRGTRYVNGELFARPALVHINQDEAKAFLDLAGYDWRAVDPTIFGSLMEGFLGQGRRALGAHYTHEIDIMKIVRPTIVRPWRERIQATATPEEAVGLLHELCRFRVLDPACGCGNFLYIAYRELRSLEWSLKRRIQDLSRQTGLPVPTGPLPYYPLNNLYGMDIEPVVAHIARVTLWMGHRQMMDEFGAAEPPLPLVELSTIQAADALRVPWPEVDCVIGNPPFLGSQNIRAAHGDDYITWLKETFKVGVKDYCVYWFRRTHDHLKPGQRAGLVATNSIAQNRARSASLEYVVGNGGVITDAVSTQKWPGDAKVHVSLVNWVKQPDSPLAEFWLDGAQVLGVTAELRPPEASTGNVAVLDANKGRCFQGLTPVGDGFILSVQEAQSLLSKTDANYRDVVRPYLVGDDIAEDPAQRPRRWIIDFGKRSLEQSMRYRSAIKLVRQRVKPSRDQNNDRFRREHWWIFGRPYTAVRTAIGGLHQYIAGVRVGKRLLFAWCDAWTCPSDLTNVFAFDDDYAMGVLSSFAHGAWARSRSSTLKGDFRYTPTTVFLMFPWPFPVADEQRERVAEAGRQMIARRQEICAAEGFGLTKLYNLMDDGAYQDLKRLHHELDESVAIAYGWPRAVAQDGEEVVRRLLALNREIASGERPYAPFGSEESAQQVLDIG